jgi:hypothetical protein
VLDVINRSAVIVMPAEPFLKWLHRADSTSAELTLADLRREPTIYLLPPNNLYSRMRQSTSARHAQPPTIRSPFRRLQSQSRYHDKTSLQGNVLQRKDLGSCKVRAKRIVEDLVWSRAKTDSELSRLECLHASVPQDSLDTIVPDPRNRGPKLSPDFSTRRSKVAAPKSNEKAL